MARDFVDELLTRGGSRTYAVYRPAFKYTSGDTASPRDSLEGLDARSFASAFEDEREFKSEGLVMRDFEIDELD